MIDGHVIDVPSMLVDSGLPDDKVASLRRERAVVAAVAVAIGHRRVCAPVSIAADRSVKQCARKSVAVFRILV